jgi:membrane-associated protease RseP (regulator of RpoE activity)
MARICNCKVETISIGFGKPIWSKKIKGINYQISPILLGGECKLYGEIELKRSKFAFTSLRFAKKCAIALSGVTVNVITGLICLQLGKAMYNEYLYCFGYISIFLGLFNAFPFIPCLDGGYLFYFPILIKRYGKQKGIMILKKSIELSFKILMLLNALFLPYLLYLMWKY